MPDQTPSRRSVVAGVAAGGLALPLLAACGSIGPDSATGPAPTTKKPRELAATSAIPVGGGTIFKDAEVVVTQPTKGDFKCFTAVCTHQGCIVGTVSGGEIHCPCHGSAFSITDGSVKNGPATRPLHAEEFRVKNGKIELT